MKKQLLKSALIAVAGIGLLAGSSWALSLPGATYSWSTSDYWAGSQPDVDFELKLYRDNKTNDLGIYSIDASSNITYISLFSDQISGTEVTISWSFDGTNWNASVQYQDGTITPYAAFGQIFGFYSNAIVNNTWGTWYTDSTLNTDGQEHIFVAYQGGNSSNLDNAYVYVANNIDSNAKSTMKVIDVNSVPEPTSMLLFGTGIIGLTGIIRRKR